MIWGEGHAKNTSTPGSRGSGAVSPAARASSSTAWPSQKSGDSRGAGASALGKVFEEHTDKPVIVRESVKDAFRYVLEHQKGRTVYCLGSLYLTGEIKGLIQEVKQKC